MGFFKSLFDEAGKKTGSAIGNKLFPNSTDYIRLGELGGDPEERLAAEQNAYIERDLDHNINVLTQISAILDSIPAWVYRSDLEQKIYKMAKSKMESGVAICKRIDPNSEIVKHFESKL